MPKARKEAETSKSSRTPSSLWDHLDCPPHRKRPNDQVHQNGKENTGRAASNDDLDVDDLPLASLMSLMKRPKKTPGGMTKKLFELPNDRHFPRDRPVKKKTFVVKAKSKSNTSNIETALQFLQPRRKKNKNLTLGGIQARTRKRPKTNSKQQGKGAEIGKKALKTTQAEHFAERSSAEQVNEIETQTANKTSEMVPTEDFDANEQAIRRSNNLAHQLLDRSVLGSRGRMMTHGPRRAQDLQVQRRPITAKHAAWITLGHHGGISNQTAKIDSIAFDSSGVLCAVAQTCTITKQSWIDIFDWDTVCAADCRGRNARARAMARNDKARFGLDIPPMLRFRIPTQRCAATLAKKTPWIKWNPFHTDQLAVGCGQMVYCVNVAHVEAALATVPVDRIVAPPRHAYWEFKLYSTLAADQSAASACLFLGRDQVVVGFGASLVCYQYYPTRDPTSVRPKLNWQYTFSFGKAALNRASIVSLEKIGREHVVAGSSHGHLALIQWKRVVVASAMSSFATAASANRMSPTVVSQWLSYAALSNQQVPEEVLQNPSIMGIQDIQLEKKSHQSDGDFYCSVGVAPIRQTKKVREQLCGRFRIRWVTRGGWVLSLDLDAMPSKEWTGYRVRRQKPRIVYQTAQVETRLATGAIARTKKEWSLPRGAVASDTGSQFVCWQKVATVTRTLSHHDKRILDDKPSIVRDVKDTNQVFLLFSSEGHISTGTPKGASLPVPGTVALPRRRGLPKLLAVDPVNQHWIVVATLEGRLYVVSLF